MTGELPESVIASELRNLREVTERNHKETTEQIGKLVSSERHELVTQQLKEADTRNEESTQKVSDRLDGVVASIEANAKQLRTLWLTWVLGLVGAIATSVIVGKLSGMI